MHKTPLPRLICVLFLFVLVGCQQAGNQTPEIDSAGYATYEHPTGVFELSLPSDWVVNDISSEFAVEVEYSPPGLGEPLLGIYVVSLEALNPGGESIDSYFSAYRDVRYLSRGITPRDFGFAPQPDGSVRAEYMLDTPSGATQHNDFAEVHDPYFVVTRTRIPSNPALTRTLNQIINTLTINEDAGWFSVVRTGQSDPSAAAVGFVNLNAYVNGQGGFQIVGQVANQAELSLAFVRVQAKLFDASDQLITEQDTFIPTDLLAPGEFAPFSITFADGLPSNAVRYDLEAAGRYAGESDETFYGPNNFEVVSGADFNDNGALVISGDVTNTGDNTANLVKVVITVFDEDGRVAGAASDLVENQQLGPGESSPYSVTFAELGGSAANFLVSVQGVVES